ncbi:FMN-dependent oxidoreductase (nitrilotriacetate monooxygenase family) [Nocardioides zeae]|uniref:FMN-dependent oxidoreductase (Nitrilotriacetate monooxygenase family) n=1 Tax=Nocardioides zeae TaxID=1457234 RepID=A0ACC6IF37_9ACTN|nr:LLM class flavin-dependent oxidoreductase [Nocardioides zeae]MDR6174896.1 FMN-dependent oxidoreductase (nitrilotriacetate monooxygenase family) [Nocardioides zeae]MDR6209294.1 FMN-dependent oxidoreductase (nitrilotriacetate monooxygenase family) [Nocardioides zeae]
MTAPFHLAAFMNAGPMGTVGWRHPEARPDFLDAAYYLETARLLEDARFDLLFIPDSLAVPRSLQGSFEPAVRFGAGTPRLEPLTVLALLAGATSRIGLVATTSTGYAAPYAVARTYATLDHLSGGRAGWNVVTSFQDAEAQNFGFPALPPREERYARAEEFLEAATQLWDSWSDDALVLDKESGQLGRPEEVRAVDYRGEHVATQGPLGVPRPPQGYPVIVQAGASPQGRDVAARWADVIFCSHESIESAIEFYADVKRRALEHGRDPEAVRILPAVSPVVGTDRADAQARHRAFEQLVDPVAGLSRLAYHINTDLTRYDLDGPLPELDVSGVQGHYREVLEHARRENLTVRELGQWYGARTEGYLVGSGSDIADGMEEWVDRGAADGFMIVAAHVPGSFAEFVEHVVPELRRRGRLREEYRGTTLRENLGLARPARDEWRNRARGRGAAESPS